MPHADRDKRIEYMRQYYINNKEKYRGYDLKRKPKRDIYNKKYQKSIQDINKHSDIGIPFLMKKLRAMKSRHDSVTLTPEELLELIPKDLKCPVFETKFTFGMQPASLDKQRAMTVDRIDNTKGYHKDNVVIISFKANAMKNSATLKELYQVADFYYELEKGRA
jgi:hypothetical protein